jgi:hypothetical protein
MTDNSIENRANPESTQTQQITPKTEALATQTTQAATSPPEPKQGTVFGLSNLHRREGGGVPGIL